MTSCQYFDGFHATSQFWRLHILRNHGSTKTAICNLKLYGVDALLAKWFSECGCTPVRMRGWPLSLPWLHLTTNNVQKHFLPITPQSLRSSSDQLCSYVPYTVLPGLCRQGP